MQGPVRLPRLSVHYTDKPARPYEPDRAPQEAGTDSDSLLDWDSCRCHDSYMTPSPSPAHTVSTLLISNYNKVNHERPSTAPSLTPSRPHRPQTDTLHTASPDTNAGSTASRADGQ